MSVFKNIKTAEDLENEKIEQLKVNKRRDRDIALASADIAINKLIDSGSDHSIMSMYRQSLRDFPESSTYWYLEDLPTRPNTEV